MNTKVKTLADIIEAYGIDPETVPGYCHHHVVKAIDEFEHKAQAQAGDLYIGVQSSKETPLKWSDFPETLKALPNVRGWHVQFDPDTEGYTLHFYLFKPETLGESIRHWQKIQNQSTRNVTSRARIADSQFYALKNGKNTNPTLDMVKKVAKGLGISLSKLLCNVPNGDMG